MQSITIGILIFVSGLFLPLQNSQHIRYVLIEASCKAGFDALPEYEKEVILSDVFKVEFENAFQVVNAEPDLIVDFEVALEQRFPNSRNQIKDILVYMLNSNKEAQDLYANKIKQFEKDNVGTIQLKIR